MACPSQPSADLQIRSNSVLSGTSPFAAIIALSGDATIDAGAAISADALDTVQPRAPEEVHQRHSPAIGAELWRPWRSELLYSLGEATARLCPQQLGSGGGCDGSSGLLGGAGGVRCT